MKTQFFTKYPKMRTEQITITIPRTKKGLKKELRRLKWLYYTGKLDEQTLKNLEWDVFDLDIKKNRHDLEMFLESDKDIIELNDKVEYQKEKINYLETIIKSLSTRGFLIKNSIEWKKFIMGN